MRLKRVRMSCSVESIAWPMCNWPVTFGGGMTMENGFLSGSGSALKQSWSIHI